ncbi:MAG: SGNH/GDSL hydrolase family protein [Actinomycetes bacterium]
MSWRRYVALGDSFTEGLDDPAPDGRHHGWADRMANSLAELTPELEYANLAIRGRKLPQIIDEQLPVALSMRPDLVSLVGGVNDVLRPKWDLALASDLMNRGTRMIRESGADVILIVVGDPSKRSRTLGTLAGRLERYRDAIVDIADRQGCYVADLWGAEVFDDPRVWSVDRLHLNGIGHDRVARAVLQVLGYGDDSWREPLPPAVPPSRLQTVRGDAQWIKTHLAPWVARRVRGQSSGDNVTAKRQEPGPVDRPPVE